MIGLLLYAYAVQDLRRLLASASAVRGRLPASSAALAALRRGRPALGRVGRARRNEAEGEQHEALARLFLFASESAVALGEQFVDDVGAGVAVRHLDGRAFPAAITRTPDGLLGDERVLGEPGQQVRVDCLECVRDPFTDAGSLGVGHDNLPSLAEVLQATIA